MGDGQRSKLFAVAVIGLLAICAISGAVIAYQLARVRRQANLEAQRRCTKAGKVAFPDLPYGRDERHSYYKTHYNPSLNRCFIEVAYLFGSNGHSEKLDLALYDAHDHKKYAVYHNVQCEGCALSKQFEWCELHLTYSDSNKVTCHSYEEYRAFVAKYMK